MSKWIDYDAIDYKHYQLHDKSEEFLNGVVYMAERIEEAPSIDIEPKRGEWIYGEHDVAMCDGYRCDKCGFFVPWDYEHKFIDFINDYHFCPNCGAQMKTAVNERDYERAVEQMQHDILYEPTYNSEDGSM